MANISQEEKRIIAERRNPKIYHWTFLILRQTKKETIKFNREFLKNKTNYDILDVGCGCKPYQTFFKNYRRYIGVDVIKNPFVDVMSLAWDMPFKDNEFDVIIATCILEHSLKLQKTIREFHRVLKSDGLAFIAVPFIDPEHGVPYDFWRFTQYTIQKIFSQFKILGLVRSNGFISTLIQLVNLFLAQFPYGNKIFIPVFILNNSLAIFLEWLIKIVYKINERSLRLRTIKNFYETTFCSLPRNYYIILKKL